MNDTELLSQYINSTRESTDRTRRILLIMIVASILVGTACWNSRKSGWVHSRLEMAKAMDKILNPQFNAPPDGVPTAPLVTADGLPPGEEVLYKNATDSIKKNHRTANEVHQNLFWTQKVRTDQLSQVQVPFLGISFDVNDLGLLGGVTFIVLLIWVNYSLWHYSNNLKLTFDFARQLKSNEDDPNLLYHTYQSLAMYQVLTIPPRPKSIKPRNPGARKLWIRKLYLLLYTLPLVVQMAVVVHDWVTSDIGTDLDWSATWIVLIAGSLFLCFIGILTWTCLRRWQETFETWKSVAKDI